MRADVCGVGGETLNAIPISGVIVGAVETKSVNVVQTLFEFSTMIDGSRSGVVIFCTYVPNGDADLELHEGARVILTGWLALRRDPSQALVRSTIHRRW
jgi:hypothetical protein